MALFTMLLPAAAHHSIEKVSITARRKSPHAPEQVPMTILVSDVRWKRRSFHISGWISGDSLLVNLQISWQFVSS